MISFLGLSEKNMQAFQDLMDSMLKKWKWKQYEIRKERGDIYLDLKIYRTLCADSKIIWTKHCLERMQERDISRADVKNGIATGEIIEEYPEDYPNPSCLIFGYTVNNRILHIVAGCDNINIYIITAYYPDIRKFEDDLKTRRKGK